jgi:NAD(P)-dependent dehydrogenase (short-subunit alcohol dehydrogenase family)
MSFTKTYHQAAYPAIDPTRPELSAAGKTVIITGASGGLGAETVRTFAAAGASHIIITGRTLAGLSATKEATQKLYPGTSIHPVASDLQDEAAIESAFADIAKSVGPFHVLVHNAGYLPDLDPVLASSAQEYWKGFEINVKGAFNVARAFLRNAVPKGAVIVNISTAAAHFGVIPRYSSYANSKIAALSLFNYIGGENPDVRVVNMHPGLLDTDMGKKSNKAVPVAQFDDSKFCPRKHFRECF